MPSHTDVDGTTIPMRYPVVGLVDPVVFFVVGGDPASGWVELLLPYLRPNGQTGWAEASRFEFVETHSVLGIDLRHEMVELWQNGELLFQASCEIVRLDQVSAIPTGPAYYTGTVPSFREQFHPELISLSVVADGVDSSESRPAVVAIRGRLPGFDTNEFLVAERGVGTGIWLTEADHNALLELLPSEQELRSTSGDDETKSDLDYLFNGFTTVLLVSLLALVVLRFATSGDVETGDGFGTVSYSDITGDGLIDCRSEVVGYGLYVGRCAEPGQLEGRDIRSLDLAGDDRGFDLDDDGQLELICKQGVSSSLSGEDGDVRLERGRTAEWSVDCERVERAGPYADRFVLADGSTPVDRIDVTGDGSIDFVVIGNQAPIEVSRVTPWYLLFFTGSVAASLIAVLGGLCVQWLSNRSDRANSERRQTSDEEE